MARELTSRFILKGTLTASTALHVGGIGGDADTDMALAVNGRGKYYLPGTSIAGVMRQWIRHRFPLEADSVWGASDVTHDAQKSVGLASCMFVEDAVAKLPDGANIEIRDGVGIDRFSGTAAHGIKYDRTVLPAGTQFPLEVTADVLGVEDRQPVLAQLADLVVEMKAGRLRFGASKTRGLGRVELRGVAVREQTMSTRDGMLAALAMGGEVVAPDVLAAAASGALPRPRLTLTVHWKPKGPFMVKAARDGMQVDSLPLTGWNGQKLRLLLPGSSVKGALRSHAELIMRTVRGLPAPRVTTKGTDFLDQVDDVPLVTALFGATGDRDERLGIGALATEDCYSVLTLDPTAWANVERAEGLRQLESALKEASALTVRQAYHVAIDRWTGGAADGQLFSVLEPHPVAWEPIRLEVDLARIPEAERKAALALLLLVLQDLGAGEIPLGFGANRGMGSIEVDWIDVSHLDLPEPLSRALAGVERIEDIGEAGIPPTIIDELQPAWTSYVESGASC